MAKSNRVAVLAEETRPFTVLREIKHEGQRYKEGDTIDLTRDEWVVMHGDGRVSREESNPQDGDKKPDGGDGAGGNDGADGGQGGDGQPPAGT